MDKKVKLKLHLVLRCSLNTAATSKRFNERLKLGENYRKKYHVTIDYDIKNKKRNLLIV